MKANVFLNGLARNSVARDQEAFGSDVCAGNVAMPKAVHFCLTAGELSRSNYYESSVLQQHHIVLAAAVGVRRNWLLVVRYTTSRRACQQPSFGFLNCQQQWFLTKLKP